MTDSSTLNLRESFRKISKKADEFFVVAIQECSGNQEDSWDPYINYWSKLSDATCSKALEVRDELLPLCATLASIAKNSALTDTEDVRDIRTAAKRMQAALVLREYSYREAEVIHDEGNILGLRPATQSDDRSASPRGAQAQFHEGLSAIASALKLVEAAGTKESNSRLLEPSGAKYRADTAFIMMWMTPDRPQLTDVADTIRSVFQSFGIKAVRADDIEHDGLITDRVLNEIRTSEFLIADLTGARPNVYYEVGYAHALSKRVVLFREKGTGLHFDLAGFNCPEYENLRDLRDKLTKRLVGLTNRNPTDVPKI